jgi:hypothetical protein
VSATTSIPWELLTLCSIEDPPGLDIRRLSTKFAILLGVPPWVSLPEKQATQSLSLISVPADVQRSGARRTSLPDRGGILWPGSQEQNTVMSSGQ